MEQGGRLYESDATKIARQLLDEMERDKRTDGALFTMPAEGFPSGANAGDSNTGGGGNGPAVAEGTYYALIPSGGSATITFTDSDVYAGMHLYFDYIRGDPLTSPIFGGGVLYLLHNGTAILRCDLLETTGPVAGFDAVTTPPHGFSASLSGGDLVLEIFSDTSDADDLQFWSKPIFRSRA